MKNILGSTLMVLMMSLVSFGQKLTEGPEGIVEKKVGFQKLIGSDPTGFYVLKQSTVGQGVHILVEKYSNDFKLIFSKETKAAAIQESMNFTPVTVIQSYMGDGKVLVFFESHNSNTKMLTMFVQSVSFTGELSEVYEVSSLWLKYSNPIVIAGVMYFKVSFSPDNKLFAVVPTLGVKEEDDNNFVCKIYDSGTFQKKAERIIPRKGKGGIIATGNYTIDNNGNLIYTIKYLNLDNKGKATSINGFALGLIESASPSVKTFDIAIPEHKVIHDYAIKGLKNGDLIICGIVSDTLVKGVKAGFIRPSYFIKRIKGGTLQTQYEKIEDFSEEAISQLGATKSGSTYENTEIFEIKDEVYIVSQQSEVSVMMKSFGNYMLPYATTTDLELIVSKIGNEGQTSWTRVIPKNHKSGPLLAYAQKPPRYSGNYKTFVMNDKLNVLFLDHPENAELKVSSYNEPDLKQIHGNAWGSELVVPKDKANTVLVDIDSNGNSNKKIIMQNSETGFNNTTLGNTVVMENKRLLLFLENRSTKIERFATLDF